MDRRRNQSSGVVVSINCEMIFLGESYTRLSGTPSEDQGDWGAFAVNNVVAGAATRATSKAELALLDWRSHGDRSCIEHVGEGSGVLHCGGSRSGMSVESGSFEYSKESIKTPGLCKGRMNESVVMDD
jgi:hypothetical protein